MNDQTKLGTDQLEPILMFAFELGNVGDKMGRTKGMARYMQVTALFDEATALANVDFKKAKEQFKDLDDAETEELIGKIKLKFDLVDDKLESIIEEGLDIADDLYSAVDRAIDLFKKAKAEA